MVTKTQTNPSRTSWFSRIPRHFFNFPLLVYSSYVGIGFAITGLLHYRVWMNSSQVETLFTALWKDIDRPTPEFALMLYFLTAFVVTVLFHLLIHKVRKDAGIVELVFWGTSLGLFFSWVPWLYASSIVSTVFLFLFNIISLAGFGLTFKLLSNEKEKEQGIQPDVWKMLVNATKICAAIFAILLGAIATTVLMPWRNTHVEEFELLRYAFLCAYLALGMLSFIIMPLFSRSLVQGPTDDVELDPPGLI